MTHNTNNSMNPDLIQDLLSAYIDDEVSREEKVRVEQALASSLELRQEFEGLQQTVHQVKSLPYVPAPRPFTLSEADVHPVKTKPFNLFTLPLWLGSLASVATLLVIVLFIGWAIVGQQVVKQSTASSITTKIDAEILKASPSKEAVKDSSNSDQDGPIISSTAVIASRNATVEAAQSQPNQDQITGGVTLPRLSLWITLLTISTVGVAIFVGLVGWSILRYRQTL